MKAAIRRFHSPDSPDGDIRLFAPTADAFRLLVEVDVGPHGEAGAEVFAVVVRSSDAQDETIAGGYRWVRRELILDRWDAALVERVIQQRVESTEGSTWQEIADQLLPFFSWEFENYRG